MPASQRNIGISYLRERIRPRAQAASTVMRNLSSGLRHPYSNSLRRAYDKMHAQNTAGADCDANRLNTPPLDLQPDISRDERRTPDILLHPMLPARRVGLFPHRLSRRGFHYSPPARRECLR